MKAKMTYHRNNLHTGALYVARSDFEDLCKGIRDLPRPDATLLKGIDRIRAIVPRGCTPPEHWHKIRTTVIKDVPIEQALGQMRDTARSGTEVTTMSQTHPLWEDWITSHWEVYKANHTDNPSRDLTLAEQTSLFGGPDIVKDSAVAIVQNSTVVAFASLRKSDDDSGKAELGWIGENRSFVRPHLETLISHLLLIAKAAGFSHLECEADDTDPTASRILRLLPSTHDDVFETWERSATF